MFQWLFGKQRTKESNFNETDMDKTNPWKDDCKKEEFNISNKSKSKQYRNVHFTPEAIKEAISVFDKIAKLNNAKKYWITLNLENEDVSWDHTSEEEFFSDYRQGFSYAFLSKSYEYGEYKFRIQAHKNSVGVVVTSKEKQDIEAVFEVFEKHVPSCRLPEPSPQKPKVFIGHGGNSQWKDLKDHLHEKHGHEVIAYEIGARAGHTIRDILTEMMKESTIAFLVMTGEDETADGQKRARQNVIHEAGLFQGKLGFSRAIVLLEENVEEFSNIDGIQQIRFKKNRIKETFGDVLATI